MKICRIFHFSSAHTLPNHEGKCWQLHGHNYKLEVELKGPTLFSDGPSKGMLIDFKDLDDMIKGLIIEDLDHKYLNDIVGNPTAENLILWIIHRLRTMTTLGNSIRFYRIRLWENHKSYVEVGEEDL